jgi:competence protein ComK
VYKKLIRNNEVKYMIGEYDNTGNFCTRIYIEGNDFLINKTPINIIDDMLNHIGFSYKGAVTGSNFILGKRYMPPVIVCPFQNICFFPHKSVVHVDCIWFNVDQISKTSRVGNKTKVEFFDGTFIIVDSKVTNFSAKYTAADQLVRNTKRSDI